MGLLSTGLDFMTGGALTGNDLSNTSMSDVLTDEAKRRLREQLENAGNQGQGAAQQAGQIPGAPVAPSSISAYQQPQPMVNGMPMLGATPLVQQQPIAPQYAQATNLLQHQPIQSQDAQATYAVQPQPFMAPVPDNRTPEPVAEPTQQPQQAQPVAPVAPVAPPAAPVQQTPAAPVQQTQPPQTVASLAPLSVQPPVAPVAAQPGAEAMTQQLATNLSANANAAGAPVKPQTYGRGDGSAASVNNPSGLGAQKDANGQYVWRSYDTPAEGVADTQALVNKYLQTPGRNTPEGFVGTWVTGDAKQGASVQGGAYAASVRKELAAAGVELNPDGTIPNTKAANDAITRAVIAHESGAKNAEQFLPHVGQALIPSGQQAAGGATLAQGAPASDTGPVTAGSPKTELDRLNDLLHPKKSLTPKEQQRQLADFAATTQDPAARRLALDNMLENRQHQQGWMKAKEDLANPKTDYTRELKKTSDEGSYLKYYIAKRLGLTAMANEEANKLGYGHSYKAMVDEDGKTYQARYDSRGQLVSAKTAEGKPVNEATLAKLAANPIKQIHSASAPLTDPVSGRQFVLQTDTTGNAKYAPVGGGAPITPAEQARLGKLGEEQKRQERLQSVGDTVFKQEYERLSAIAVKDAQIYGKPVMSSAEIAQRAQAAREAIISGRGVTSATAAPVGAAPISPAQVTPPAGAAPVVNQQPPAGAAPVVNQQPPAGAAPNGTQPRPPAQPGPEQTAYYNNTANWDQWRPRGIPGIPADTDKTYAERQKVVAQLPALQSQAEKIANYEEPMPAMGRGQPVNIALMDMVHQIDKQRKAEDPDNHKPWNAANYEIAKRTRLSFATGKDADKLDSHMTVIKHEDTLLGLIDNLNNTNSPLWNKVANEWEQQTGKAAPITFDAAKQLVGDEIAKAAVGGRSALGDREEIKAVLNRANSPQQLKEVVLALQELQGGQLTTLRDRWTRAGLPLKDFLSFLDQPTREALERADESAKKNYQRRVNPSPNNTSRVTESDWNE